MTDDSKTPTPVTLQDVISTQSKMMENNFRQMLWTLISTSTLYHFSELFKAQIIGDIVSLAELMTPEEVKNDSTS